MCMLCCQFSLTSLVAALSCCVLCPLVRFALCCMTTGYEMLHLCLLNCTSGCSHRKWPNYKKTEKINIETNKHTLSKTMFMIKQVLWKDTPSAGGAVTFTVHTKRRERESSWRVIVPLWCFFQNNAFSKKKTYWHFKNIYQHMERW